MRLRPKTCLFVVSIPQKCVQKLEWLRRIFGLQLKVRITTLKDVQVADDLKKSQANIFFVDDRIALASGIHESRTILDGYMPSCVGDESCLLQCGCSDGNGTSAGAQHGGQKLVRYGQTITLNPVTAHQEPTG
jgi:hypothetical protein